MRATNVLLPSGHTIHSETCPWAIDERIGSMWLTEISVNRMHDWLLAGWAHFSFVWPDYFFSVFILNFLYSSFFFVCYLFVIWWSDYFFRLHTNIFSLHPFILYAIHLLFDDHPIFSSAPSFYMGSQGWKTRKNISVAKMKVTLSSSHGDQFHPRIVKIRALLAG